jgi:hypothetical protein
MANREPRHVGTRCFGRADFFVETRIVDVRGNDTEVDVPGELLVRAVGDDPRADFFLGYLKDEMATEGAWAGGWFHTGDVVRRSAEGDFHFVDRRKNVIRRSGENISAVEVESVLDTTRRWPRAPSPRRPTRPAATRCSPASSCARPPTCRRRRRSRRASSATPSRALVLQGAGLCRLRRCLPLTSSQKVQRGELRQLAKRLPSSPQCHDMRMLKRRQKRIDAAAGQGGVSALGTLTSAASSRRRELSGAGTLSGAGGLTRAGELAGPDAGALSRHRRNHAASRPQAEDARRARPPAPLRRAEGRRRRRLTCRARRTRASPLPCR